MILIDKYSNEFKLKNIADIISSFPLVILLSYTYSIVTDFSKEKIIFLVGFLIVSGIVDIIKRLPYPNNFIEYTFRPDDACDCNLLSNQGPVPRNPGFPSGHMATITFFVTYLILTNKQSNKLVLLSLIVMTGWARHYKYCHTLLQIIFGTIFGCFMALIWCKLF